MTDDADLGFAPAHDAPIPYLQRTRTYYQALGYGTPYAWAHYADVPFTPLTAPLARARIALITTAAPYQPDKGDQGPGAPYNAAARRSAGNGNQVLLSSIDVCWRSMATCAMRRS